MCVQNRDVVINFKLFSFVMFSWWRYSIESSKLGWIENNIFMVTFCVHTYFHELEICVRWP